MAIQIQFRRDTAANWTSSNPTLAAGELGFETDTRKFKLGTGSSTWSQLQYGALLSGNALIPGGNTGQILAKSGTGNYEVEWIDQPNLAEYATLSDPTFSGTVTLPTTTSVGDVSSNELGRLSGVTSPIQAQLDTKAPLSAPTFTGSVVLPSTTTIGSVSSTELGYLDGVTSSIQTQLGGKQDTITGAATTITGSDLTTSRVLVSNTSGKVAVSLTNSTELGYVSGVTSAIQTQLDAKLASSTAASTYAPLAAPTFTGTVVLPSTTSIGNVSATEIGYVDGVTSAIQTQLDAKLASSTAASTYAALSGSTFTGAVVVSDTTQSTTTTSGSVKTAGGLGVAKNAYIGGNLVISGDFTVNGTTTTVSTTDLSVTDPLIYIGTGNSANSVDIGVVGHFNDGTYQHTGIVRDASDGKWKLFSNVINEPTTTIDFTGATYDTLKIGALEATSATIGSVTNTEIGYLSGVTSSIQTQLGTKLASATAASTYAPLASPTFTGSVTTPLTTAGVVTTTSGGLLSSITYPRLNANTFGYTSTATAAGSTTLTASISVYQLFTGTSTQTVVLPVTSTLTQGWTFHIVNNSTGALTVNSSGGNLVATIPANMTVMATCVGTSLTTAADWEYGYTDFGAITGTGSAVLATSPTIDTPTFTGTATLSSSGLTFSNGTVQTVAGVPSLTTISQKVASYTLAAVTERDTVIEISNASANTLTVPLDSTLSFPTGSSLDLIQTGAGQMTITPATTTSTYSSGGASAATTFVIASSNSAIGVGQTVTGTGFAANTVVTNVSGTTITVSPAISSQVSGTITFSTTINATPGLKLRTQWSSATLLKRSANTWIAYGDLTA
jgi:hypothetical protein